MKEKKKLLWLLVLVALLVAVNVFWSASSSPASGSRKATKDRPRDSFVIPDATFDAEKLERPDRVRAEDVERNIFEYARARRAPGPIKKPPVNTTSTPTPPPPPPKPPLRFFGFAEASAGSNQRVFLTDGEEIFVASEGDLVLKRYRVTRVERQKVEVEDVTAARSWILPLEQP